MMKRNKISLEWQKIYVHIKDDIKFILIIVNNNVSVLALSINDGFN